MFSWTCREKGYADFEGELMWQSRIRFQQVYDDLKMSKYWAMMTLVNGLTVENMVKLLRLCKSCFIFWGRRSKARRLIPNEVTINYHNAEVNTEGGTRKRWKLFVVLKVNCVETSFSCHRSKSREGPGPKKKWSHYEAELLTREVSNLTQNYTYLASLVKPAFLTSSMKISKRAR